MGIFRSFWYKGALTPYEHMCLKSFISYGHKFYLYSYDKIEVPDGVVLMDAGEVISEERYFCYADGPGRGSPSAFSNLFRYELLLRYGDWWVDTDVICMSENVPENEFVYAYEDTAHINGAIIKLPQGSSLAFQLLAEASALGKNISWGQAGPVLITRVVKKNSFEKYCLPTEMLYPLNYDEALLFLLPEAKEQVAEKCAKGYFVHLWNEILKRSAIRKDISPPEGSFLHDQFLKYDVKFPSRMIYTASEIDFINQNSFINRYRMEQERDAAVEAYETLKANLELEYLKVNNVRELEEIHCKIEGINSDMKDILYAVKRDGLARRLFSKIMKNF